MSRILWTALALEDLQGISLYIESRSTLATANRVCRTIYNAVQRLRHFPETGKAGLEDGTREIVVPDFSSVHHRLPASRASGDRDPENLAREAAAHLNTVGQGRGNRALA